MFLEKFVTPGMFYPYPRMRSPIYKIVFLFCLSLVCRSASAQNVYLDSLQDVLKKNNLADTQRLDLMIKIADVLAPDHQQQARSKYWEVYDKAKKIKSPYYMAEGMSGLGRLVNGYDRDSAMYYYRLTDSLFALDPSETGKQSRATNKASIADIQRSEGHFEEAIKTFLETISIVEKGSADNKKLVLAILYSNIASVYYDLQRYGKTLEYDLKALDMYRSQGDLYYVGVAEIFVSGDYRALKRNEEAKVHIENAEKLARKINSPDLFYRVYDAWGGYYEKLGDYKKAVSVWEHALPYALNGNDNFRKMDCYRMLGFTYAHLKNYPKALANMQEALARTRQLKNKPLEAELLKRIADAYSAVNNSEKAVQYYKDFIVLNDSLNANQSKQRVTEIEKKYQTEKKRDSIRTLQDRFAVQSIQLRQKQTLNFALIGGCILLLLLALLSYKNYQNKNRLLAQKELLHEQKINELENEKKLLAAQSLMKGQEAERSRLARDLHDGVGGLLSGVKLSISTMKGNVFLSEESARSFENVILQLDQSISELRRVSHNMMPEALIKYGLKEALENYCENLNLSGPISVQLQTYGLENRMEQNTEIVIYRITQELLNNVIKHAEAKNVLIQLVREEGRFNLTVEDDGKGFDFNEMTPGAGLANIKARIDYLNGTMDVAAKKGEGTSVHIEGQCA